MTRYFKVFLLMFLAITSAVYAAPAPKRMPPINASNKVPGISADSKITIMGQAVALAETLIGMFGDKAGIPPGTRIGPDETQCLIALAASTLCMDYSARFAAAGDAVLSANYLEAAKYYQDTANWFCGPGGPPQNRGMAVMVAATAGAKAPPVQKVKPKGFPADWREQVKDLEGAINGKRQWTARDTAIVVIIGAAVLVKESVPLPTP